MGKLKCNACGHRYQQDEITILGNKDDLWFLSLFCPQCSSSGLVAAVVGRSAPTRDDFASVEKEAFRRLSPLSWNDVLDMHNWLAEFDGDFARLFSTSTSKND